MSIFDKRSDFDPGPWLKQKTHACLRDVAELVDLANEPDTTPWYARRLRRAASGLVSRLAPLTLFVHRAEPKALEGAEWNAITEHGTFALAAWCERWGIAGAKFLTIPTVSDDDEDDTHPLAGASPGRCRCPTATSWSPGASPPAARSRWRRPSATPPTSPSSATWKVRPWSA